jgi:hypothetical protein
LTRDTWDYIVVKERRRDFGGGESEEGPGGKRIQEKNEEIG